MPMISYSRHIQVYNTAKMKGALTVVSNSEPEPKGKCNNLKPKEVCGSCKKIVHKCQYPDDSMRLMQPWVCGHKCWQSSQDRLCMPWIMYMKDLICYCICIVNTSMQSSSYLSSSYLGLVSYYLYAVLVSWATLSMRRRVWLNPSSYHAQHAKTCINWPAVAFSVLLGACNFCHLCGISMVGSTWLHMLSMLISLCLLLYHCLCNSMMGIWPDSQLHWESDWGKHKHSVIIIPQVIYCRMNVVTIYYLCPLCFMQPLIVVNCFCYIHMTINFR